MKAKKVAVLSALLAVATFGAWYCFPSKNDARILGDLPPEILFTPRSGVVKPIIDITVFGHPIVFPSRSASVGAFVDSPRTSGFLTWNLSDPGSPWPVASFSQAVWERNGKAYRTWSEADQDLFNCPFGTLPTVFGSQSQTFDVTWTNYGQVLDDIASRRITIELPASGKPSPPLKTVSAKAGALNVVFTPLDWIGPGFRPRYQVHIENANPRDLFFIGFHNGSFPESVRHQNEAPAVVSMPLIKGGILINITQVVMSNRMLTFHYDTQGNIRLRDSSGSLLVKGGTGQRGTMYSSASPRIFTIKVNSCWMNLAYDESVNVGNIFQPKLDSFVQKDGDIWDAEVYEVKSASAITVDFQIPSDSSSY